MIKFGGPVFESSGDPRAVAKAHKAKGYTAAYAPWGLKPGETERIKAIREAFAAEDIIIAEVGYWENLVDLDGETRKKNMAAMTDALYLADELGARCAVDIFGSYVRGKGDASFSAKNFSEDAFADAVDIARLLIDTVKPKTAYFTYEIFAFNIVDSPETLERLIKAVEREKYRKKYVEIRNYDQIFCADLHDFRRICRGRINKQRHNRLAENPDCDRQKSGNQNHK